MNQPLGSPGMGLVPANANDAPLKMNVRLALVCCMAIAVSLPMALISLAKVSVFVGTACFLIARRFNNRSPDLRLPVFTPWIVVLAVGLFALSLSWTQASIDVALPAFVKHAKLLLIVMLLMLVRSAREAKLAMQCLVYGQVLVLASSWLMAMDVPLVWSERPSGQIGGQQSSGQFGADNQYVPFAQSYIDQSLMLVMTATIVWHQSPNTLRQRLFALVFVVAVVLNVFWLMPGRTTYIAATVCMVLAIGWQMPYRFRLAALLAGVLGIGILMFSATPFQARMFVAIEEFREFQAYGTSAEPAGSITTRMTLWQHAVRDLQAQPWTGYGVGGWHLATENPTPTQQQQVATPGPHSNPHQEFLLWGVEVGGAGVLLLVALLLAIAKDAVGFCSANWRSLVSVLVALTIACLFNSPLFDDLLGDFICVALGLLLAAGMHEASGENDLSQARKISS